MIDRALLIEIAVQAIEALHLETLSAQGVLSAVDLAIINHDDGGRNAEAEQYYRSYLARIRALIIAGNDWRDYRRGGFAASLAGLRESSASLDVVSAGIAATTGFMMATNEFRNSYAAGATSASLTAIDTGASLAAVTQQFTQGNITNTDIPLNMVINGDGFFVLQNSNNAPLYSRSGSFHVDSQGNITGPAGTPASNSNAPEKGTSWVPTAASGPALSGTPGSAASAHPLDELTMLGRTAVMESGILGDYRLGLLKHEMAQALQFTPAQRHQIRANSVRLLRDIAAITNIEQRRELIESKISVRTVNTFDLNVTDEQGHNLLFYARECGCSAEVIAQLQGQQVASAELEKKASLGG